MRLFVILSRVPYPLDKGDKLRAYHQIKYLNKHHEVFLCCINDEPGAEKYRKELEGICSHLEIINLSRFRIYLNLFLALFGRRPYQVRYFYQQPAHNKVKAIINDFKPEAIYCQLVRTAEYVKQELDIVKTLDYMDALSANMMRRKTIAPWYAKGLLASEYQRMLTYENLIFEYFEHASIISEQDRDLIFHNRRSEIAVIPNGVDESFFEPMEVSQKDGLVFTGNMNYPPNVDCAHYLVNEIMPVVWQQMPEVKLTLSGTSPTPSVKALASDKVIVTGRVDDIRQSYAKAAIFVAPMRLGTGLQNKLLEAMAMGLPCITSRQVNNAIGAEKGADLLIGDDAASVANHILHLLNNPQAQNDMGARGKQFVLKNYTWKQANEKLNALILKEKSEVASQ